jgi:SAM-dependent methyltransferase
MLPLDGRGLEIGPGYNPLLPKAERFLVETADYTDADGLRAKYEGNPHVDVTRIEPVDHVLVEGRTLAEVVGRPRAFDYVIASHVIEHTPDMLQFLKSCEELLTPDGVLLLAVPDKRHCFDVFQPLTSTGAVLQAHIDKRTRPSPGVVFDDVAYGATRDGAIGWSSKDQSKLELFASLREATEAYDSVRYVPGYRDVHVWRFVPSSFRLIALDLHGMGEIRLREKCFHEGEGNEFYMTLTLTAAGCPADRLTLAKRTLREQASINLDFD